MLTKQDYITFLNDERNKLINEFEKLDELTKKVFLSLIELSDKDLDSISENRRFRVFLTTFKEIIVMCFENHATKSYMRSLFKHLNNKNILAFYMELVPSRSTEIKQIMEIFVVFFVYWQDPETTKENKLQEILRRIDRWM